MDGFVLEGHIKDITGFNYIVEIIDSFSKYLKSYVIIENNAENILICLKDFCFFVGIPNILQTDNGIEYKNNILNNFCLETNINHVFSSPHHPQTNGVIEVSHKENRKYIFNQIFEDDKNINL